jgi:uncharacterized protein YhbP (UPF0306 family)
MKGMKLILVISSEDTGAVLDAADAIAKVLGPAQVTTSGTMPPDITVFDRAILCIDSANRAGIVGIERILEEQADWFAPNLAAMLCYEAPEGAETTCEIQAAAIERTTGSRLNLVRSIQDRESLEGAISFAIEAKERLDLEVGTNPPPKDVVFEELDAFLRVHNTCTLCTNGARGPRATPMEYHYDGKEFHFLSESGLKFANILLNPEVSIAIYDNYKGFSNLAGVQITGRAEIVPPTSDEYVAHLAVRGLADRLANLDFTMNLIKVAIIKAEFLYSGFQNQGYDAKQVYEPEK